MGGTEGGGDGEGDDVSVGRERGTGREAGDSRDAAVSDFTLDISLECLFSFDFMNLSIIVIRQGNYFLKYISLRP